MIYPAKIKFASLSSHNCHKYEINSPSRTESKYGSAKKKGTWDITYFYKKLEADATIGLLTDSDFAGGGTDAKGHVFSATYAFHNNWNFKATYFINQIDLASGDPKDYDRLMLDLNFKFH